MNTQYTPDCLAGHPEAKSSLLAFRLRTRPIGLHVDDTGTYALANCIFCKSTIVYPEVTHVS